MDFSSDFLRVMLRRDVPSSFTFVSCCSGFSWVLCFIVVDFSAIPSPVGLCTLPYF